MVFKKEFIKHYLELSGGTKKSAIEAYDNVFNCLADFLYVEGREVCIKDFGTFRIKDFKARRSTHPGTGESFILPARKVVVFKQLHPTGEPGTESDEDEVEEAEEDGNEEGTHN